MIVRFHIDPTDADHFDYLVTYEGETLYADSDLPSIEACIVAATEGLGSQAVAAEVAYKGVISGTYPLATLALASSQLAEHALNTTTAIEEVMRGSPHADD
jgi:hypothetical protein